IRDLDTTEVPKIRVSEQQLNDLLPQPIDGDAFKTEGTDLASPEFANEQQRASAMQQLLKEIQTFHDRVTDGYVPKTQQEYQQTVRRVVGRVVTIAGNVLQQPGSGLADPKIDVESAMVTALVSRLDLRNQRGFLADDRRDIKYAADDLRSILDIRVTQSLRTPAGENKPFAFSFDDSQTRLRLALDTPLNRRAQRNSYRVALIDYDRTRRALMQLEDDIKLDVRQDIRQLALRRDQYEIAIASAALAYERVVSTRLQLQLAVQNVVARDFLEAQQAYTASLSNVASQHIGYILDRIELFFDLEAIRLDPLGNWVDLRNEEIAPTMNGDFESANPRPYGELVPGLWYSHQLKDAVHAPR
ncbi:MAG: hypothetical protein AAFP69_11550, partial [Planctomycetota bacterium]